MGCRPAEHRDAFHAVYGPLHKKTFLKRTPQQDDFYHLMNGKFCGEAWDAISRYVYTALQGGSIMHGWTNDERMMITCCNDGTRPVILKIERILLKMHIQDKYKSVFVGMVNCDFQSEEYSIS